MTETGWRNGEMMVLVGARGVGKSTWFDAFQQQLLDQTEWCWETFGPPSEGRWHWHYAGDFRFEREEDLELFLLRWS